MNNKSITLIGVNFYPEDTAIGLYSTQMMQYLEKQGYNLNVITGVPYYPQWKIKEEYKKRPKFSEEVLGKIKIFRYRLYVPKKPSFLKRILHLVDFTLGSLPNVFKIKSTDIIICVIPFTSALFLGWILKKRTGAKLLAHIQDFEFDAALQSGVSKNDSIIKRIFFKLVFLLERSLLNKAEIVSTISNTMLKKLKYKTKTTTIYFPNWIEANIINPEKAKPHPFLRSDKFKILYSGNVGDKQDWDLFLKMLAGLKEMVNIEIIIVGAGAKYDWLTKQIEGNPTVTFYKPVPYNELADLLCSADLHILFQKREVLNTVMPSKLLGMMASGKPSIITGNKISEVKKIIDKSEGGIYLETNDNILLMNEIKAIINNQEKAEKMGKNAREFVLANFDKKTTLDGFEKVLKNL